MDEQSGATPFLAMDPGVVATRYQELVAALPRATVLYAVKANPSRRILRQLRDAGSSFDVASPGEIQTCLSCVVESRKPEVLVIPDPRVQLPVADPSYVGAPSVG